MEALELAEQFKEEIDQYEIALEEFENKQTKVRPAKPRPNPLFNNRNIFEHVLVHLKAIRSSEIENTLRFLNYKQSTQLLFYLEHFVRNVFTFCLILFRILSWIWLLDVSSTF